MRSYPGASGGRRVRVLTIFSLSLLLLGLLALPASGLPNPSPSLNGLVYTVNTTADDDDGSCDPLPSGDCTLREAISEAYGSPGADTIAFNIPDTDPNYGYDTPGVWTVILDSLLGGPNGDILDGTSQAANYGSDTNRYRPEIKVSGEALAPGTNYWRIRFGSGNSIKGLVMNRFPFHGLWIESDDNIITGNYIGTDCTGTAPLGNNHGVRINNEAHDNTVGPGNIIAHSAYGLWVHDEGTTGNTITQNSIHSNSVKGIHPSVGGNNELAPLNLISANCSSLFGTTTLSALGIEVFSDADGQGRFYEEGTFDWHTLAFTFYPDAGHLRGRMVTATRTDTSGNTSPFSDPVHCGCPEIYLPLIMKGY